MCAILSVHPFTDNDLSALADAFASCRIAEDHTTLVAFGGDGIVSKGVENTIRNVGRLAAEGMRKTDAESIKIMLS